jgi:L-serine dehydratase
MNECISVFDMLKIGVGPSSSHTLGPWRGAERFLNELRAEGIFEKVTRVQVDLYGSLSLTGKGHATDLAVMLGLSGADPEYVPIEDIANIINDINLNKTLILGGIKPISFTIATDIVFNKKLPAVPCQWIHIYGYSRRYRLYIYFLLDRRRLCSERRTGSSRR